MYTDQAFYDAVRCQIEVANSNWSLQLVDDSMLLAKIKRESHINGIIETKEGANGIEYVLLAPASLITQLQQKEQFCYFSNKLNEYYNLRSIEDPPKNFGRHVPYLCIAVGLIMGISSATMHQLRWADSLVDSGLILEGTLFAIKNHVAAKNYLHHENDRRTMFSVGPNNLDNMLGFIRKEGKWLEEFRQNAKLELPKERPGYNTRSKELRAYCKEVLLINSLGLGT